AQERPAEAGFDLHTVRSLGRGSRNGRLIFAAAFGLLSLAILPWQIPAVWVAALVAWELVNPVILDGPVVRLPYQQGITLHAVCNFVGAAAFHVLALLSLSDG